MKGVSNTTINSETGLKVYPSDVPQQLPLSMPALFVSVAVVKELRLSVEWKKPL